MQIYFIRHAIAEDRETWTEDDALRPLTARGKKRMKQIIKGAKTLGISFDYLFVSPLVRAQETAEIAARGLRFKGDIQALEALEPDSIPADLIPCLSRLEGSASVGLVGHEPHISRTISYLLSGNHTLSIGVKKGAIVALEADAPFQAQRVALQWLLQPKHLVAIGKSS